MYPDPYTTWLEAAHFQYNGTFGCSLQQALSQSTAQTLESSNRVNRFLLSSFIFAFLWLQLKQHTSYSFLCMFHPATTHICIRSNISKSIDTLSYAIPSKNIPVFEQITKNFFAPQFPIFHLHFSRSYAEDIQSKEKIRTG